MDRWIHLYFRSHPALGSKDRAFIAETTYTLLRWKGLIDHLCKDGISWEERYALLDDFVPEHLLANETIPLHIRVSFPEELFALLSHHYGTEKAVELCLASNSAAPTTVRTNTMKISRDDLLSLWKERFSVSPTILAPEGIIFADRMNFFQLPEFKQGLFEVQDEGSQLVAAQVKVQPGDLVLDFCAGAGGKTLAFAPQLEGKGQIYLHDVRSHALQEAKQRLRRAGIQNAQVVMSDSKSLKSLKKKMDWVLVDVPCSGTGTIRRNPDIKWHFTAETLNRLIGQQRTIFEQALSFLKPSGTIVYATCSLLQEENEQQVDYFLRTYNLALCAPPLQTVPTIGGMDGFFCASMKLKEKV